MLWSLLLFNLCWRCCRLASKCFFNRRCDIRIW